MDFDVSVDDAGPDVVVRPRGRLDHATVPRFLLAVARVRKGAAGRSVCVDAAALTALDSAGAATLDVLRAQGDVRLDAASLSAPVRATLNALPAIDPASIVAVSATPPGLFENVGNAAWTVATQLKDLLYLVSDTFVAAFSVSRKSRRALAGAVSDQAIRLGMNALPIVGLVALLLGLIMAFQAAFQLRQFGANIYVADLVSVSMVRELGPLMTAILMAGRSGSAISAELGTMRVNEEIDALHTMGLDPVRFLVVPRFWAITLTQPALTLYAEAIALTGGFLIAVTYLDLSAAAYVNQSIRALTLGDLMNGLLKSLVFAWIIVIVGCYTGLSIRGGAESVGRATTRSVVASLFAIIVADSIFTTVSTIAG
jgi:phospholipid/cholesterol/gamma-HCH transport system permease protein